MAVTKHDSGSSPAYLAERLGLDAADVEVVMRWLDIVAVDDRITGREGAEVAALLDPHYSGRPPARQIDQYASRDPGMNPPPGGI